MTIAHAPEGTSSAANTAVLNATDASFVLKYFPLHNFGATSRALLVIGGADYKLEFPGQVWPQEKPNEPLEVLPVLTINTPSGQQVKVSESMTIELLLARRFNLLGDNDWESTLIQSFYSSTTSTFVRLIFRAFRAQPSARQAELDLLLTKILPEWARTNEEHLVRNGGNGHYVGNRLSLADIRTGLLLEYLDLSLSSEYYKEFLSPEKTPNLFKVKASLQNQPRYAAWIKTEEHVKLDKATVGLATSINPLFRPDLVTEA